MLEVLLLSIMAGLATCLGGIIVLLLGRPGEKSLAVFLGLATGIMLSVVLLDLLPSAWKYSDIFITGGGFCLGVAVLALMDFSLKLIRPSRGGIDNYLLNMGYLIAVGIALHDLPEGIAIAAGYETTHSLGWMLALAIGLHNIPEGMATTAPLRMGGMSRRGVLAVNGLVSVFTPAGALLGIILTKISPHWLSLLLAMAGGAMVYIVRFELIPEAGRRHPVLACLGTVLGAMVIIVLSELY